LPFLSYYPFDPFNPFVFVSPFVNALNRAAFNPNGNSRSGWLQQFGNTEKRIERIEGKTQKAN
jgi:hypothetical protein